MADAKISALASTSALNDADELAVVQSGTTKKVQAQDLLPTGAVGDGLTGGGGDPVDVVVDDTTIEVNISNELAVKDGGIDTTQLAADAVDGTKIADDAVDSEHIADDAVTRDKIDDQAISRISQQELTEQTSGASSTWVTVATFDIPANTYDIGDIIYIKMGVECTSGDTGCYARLVAYNFDGDSSSDPMLPEVSGNIGYFTTTELDDQTAKYVLEAWIQIVSANRIVARCLFTQANRSAVPESDVAIWELEFTSINAVNSEIRIRGQIEDTTGNGNITFYFMTVEVAKP